MHSDSQHVQTHVLHRGMPTLHICKLGFKVVLVTLFNQKAEKKTEKLLRFFWLPFPQRKEGRKRGEGVFLDGVNNCRVTVWASLTQTENKKHTEKCWNSRIHCRTQTGLFCLATKITSTWLAKKSQNKTVINDIYWHNVNVLTVYALQLYAPSCTTAGSTHGGRSFSCVERGGLTYQREAERQWLENWEYVAVW